MTPDMITGSFGAFGAFFVLLSIRQAYIDKEVKGVSWVHFIFFLAWGYWNLYFYPHLGQWLSFYGGVGIVSANTVLVVQILYYKRFPGGITAWQTRH